MNALELAKKLDAETVKTVKIDILHTDTAAMLRKQAEAIKVLREALVVVSDGDVYLPPITKSIVFGAIQATKEFQ